MVICDATVGTPFLQPVLRRENPDERPDFVIHSYTKDLAGYGATTAGVVIARNERMFLPKGASASVRGPKGKAQKIDWDATLFWNVYYIKGAFLDADKAYEVINGMRTLELRMLSKCITTTVFARILAAHPSINVNCSAIPGHPNAPLREAHMFLGLPAPLFTIDFEAEPGRTPIPRNAFKALENSSTLSFLIILVGTKTCLLAGIEDLSPLTTFAIMVIAWYPNSYGC